MTHESLTEITCSVSNDRDDVMDTIARWLIQYTILMSSAIFTIFFTFEIWSLKKS